MPRGFEFSGRGRQRVQVFGLAGNRGVAFLDFQRQRVRVFVSRAPEGSSFCAAGAKGFEFLGPGRQRVRVFGPWVPEGSCFLDSERQRVRVLARVRPRVRILGVVRERVRLRVPVLKNYGLQKNSSREHFHITKMSVSDNITINWF